MKNLVGVPHLRTLIRAVLCSGVLWESAQAQSYNWQPVTTYHDQRVTVLRPVWEYEEREETYTVRRPVYETSEREETYTVRRPVYETSEREERYTVLKPVYETVEREEEHSAYVPVVRYQTYYDGSGGSMCVPVTSYSLRTVTRKVPVQSVRYEREERVRKVPVQKVRYVEERKVRKVPVQSVRYVEEQKVRKVQVPVRRMVEQELVRQMPYTSYRPVTTWYAPTQEFLPVVTQAAIVCP